MKREDRAEAIMNVLMERRSVTLEDLAERFGVSKMTIHRDLDNLEQAGVLRKTRGGATIEAGTRFESDYRFRERQGTDAKATIARAALALIEPGMTVMINDGSTAATLGRMLPAKRPLSVITNNAAVMDVLRCEPGITLIALGGVYSPKYNGFFGIVTETALAQLRADLAFVSAPAVCGVQAFHMEDGVMRVKRAMIAAAARNCLLVHHQRFDRTALHHLADLSEFDTLLTDAPPTAPALAALTHAGLRLTLAK